MLNFLKNIGPVEIIVLVAILLLLFGKKIFIALGKISGETFREIKRFGKSFTDDELSKDKEEVSK